MPELPDVEVFRRYFNRTSLHQKIEKVHVDTARVLDGITIKDFQDRLTGNSFEETRRHGKHMFAGLNNTWLMIHFGMTGFFQYYTKKDQEPAHPRVLFHFDNGYVLAWDNQRMLGKVELTKSPQTYVEENDLGPDALSPELSLEKFRGLFQNKKGMIKPSLMDQSLLAGIGNVYSDEILFQCRIHPKTNVQKLTEEDFKKMYSAMKDVLNTVIETGIDPADMPDSLMTHHRGKDNNCPGCSGKMEKIKVSGRNGYYCPGCQKKK